jgi:hypothetical protein
MRRLFLFAGIVWALASCGRKDPAQETLERQFSEKLTGATLAGHFSERRSEGVKEDRYDIEKVSKIAGDKWLIQARIRYGSRDVTVPVPITVRWAGDTPVLQLTDVDVPGMGSFTVRLLIYGDRYAGTWDGKDHGGEMSGRILRQAK